MIELHIATGLCSGRWWWWFSWILLWYTRRRERFVFPACQMLAVPKKIGQMFPSIQEGVVLKPKWLNPKFNWPRCLLTIQVTQSQWQWKMSLSKFKRSTTTGWWFQICFIFTIWGRFPSWLIFFKGVGSTTNQKSAQVNSSLLWGVSSPQDADSEPENPSV